MISVEQVKRLSALVVLSCCPMTALAGSYFSLWDLVDHAAFHVAPATVQVAMQREEAQQVQSCKGEQGLSEDQAAHYFSAVKINLGAKTAVHYLVFPRFPCSEYFGAHSVRFWIMEMSGDGVMRNFLSSQQDRVEVLTSSHQGLLDVRLHYNKEQRNYQFDRHEYVRSETFTISISEAGFTVNGLRYGSREELAKALKSSRVRRIHFEIEKGSSYDRVAQAMGAAQDVGADVGIKGNLRQ